MWITLCKGLLPFRNRLILYAWHSPVFPLCYYAASCGRGCLCRSRGHPGSPSRTFLQSPHLGCSHPIPRNPEVPAGRRGSAPWRRAPYPSPCGWLPAAGGAAWCERLPRPHVAFRHSRTPSACPWSRRWPLRVPLQPQRWHTQRRFLWNLHGKGDDRNARKWPVCVSKTFLLPSIKLSCKSGYSFKKQRDFPSPKAKNYFLLVLHFNITWSLLGADKLTHRSLFTRLCQHLPSLIKPWETSGTIAIKCSKHLRMSSPRSSWTWTDTPFRDHAGLAPSYLTGPCHLLSFQ